MNGHVAQIPHHSTLKDCCLTLGEDLDSLGCRSSSWCIVTGRWCLLIIPAHRSLCTPHRLLRTSVRKNCVTLLNEFHQIITSYYYQNMMCFWPSASSDISDCSAAAKSHEADVEDCHSVMTRAIHNQKSSFKQFRNSSLICTSAKFNEACMFCGNVP